MSHLHTRESHRTDPEIFAEARIALDRCPNVPETVHVHVTGGTARLTGTVRLRSHSLEAETAVRMVEGVRRVINDVVTVEPARASGYEMP